MRKMNEGGLGVLLRKQGLKTWNIGVSCLALVLALSLSNAQAGTDMKEIKAPSMCSMCCEKDWTIELGSGAKWSNVRSGQPNQAYTLVPINLTASLKLDEVGLDNYMGGWLRGYSEFYFSGCYDFIVHGPENYYSGIMVGPRYNFVQPGWKIIPFVEGGIGIGFADSNPTWGGLGQDFNFTFAVAAGAKYNLNKDWFVRLAAEYQHVSSAGLSEPQFDNHPIDGLGPKLSLGYSF